MSSFNRFRSVVALLGERQELERQEIYFAAPEANCCHRFVPFNTRALAAAETRSLSGKKLAA
jgi:hypothetical protein